MIMVSKELASRFERYNSIGAYAETVAYMYLKEIEGLISIDDVSRNQYFQKLDIDFVVTDAKGHTHFIEVKHDYKTDGSRKYNIRPTGHIIYETMSNGNVGCLERSKADIVLYITTKWIYSINLSKCREYIRIFKPKEIEFKNSDGAKGYRLNVDELEKYGILKKVKELEREEQNDFTSNKTNA